MRDYNDIVTTSNSVGVLNIKVTVGVSVWHTTPDLLQNDTYTP